MNYDRESRAVTRTASFLWTPTWRHAKAPIEIVRHPHAPWFAEREHTRFVLLADGRLWWGDGLCVVHGDLQRAAAETVAPGMGIGAGVLMRDPAADGAWVLAALELSPVFGISRGGAHLAKLLANLATWRDDIDGTCGVEPPLRGMDRDR